MPQEVELPTLLGMHDPTYTASVAWYADDQAQEDVRRAVRDYVEATITRHQRDAREGSFNEASAFIRQSSDGAPAFGTSAYYWRRLANTPFSLRADGRMLGQNADDGFAWAAHSQLILRHFTLSGRQRRHQTELRGFARYLSEDRGDSDLDPDIYSPYLRDHNSGVELMHRVSYRPTWDSELFAEMRVRSNELSNPTLDYIRSRFGGRSQLGPVQLGGEFQFTQYLEDQDRDDDRSVPRLNLLGRWYGTPRRAGRLELRGELSYDFNRDNASGWLRLLWHFDRVQGLDDFHGDRHWFDPLLTQRLLKGRQP
jgi:hypothetical protein